MAYIIADKQFGRPVLADGTTPNPIWNELLQTATRGLYVENFSTYLKLNNIKDYEELTIAKVCLLVSIGIEVHEYPAFVKLPLENLDDAVPTYLPGAYVPDQYGEDTEELRTWSEWRENYPQSDTHAIIELSHSSTAVLGSVIKQLVDDSFEVLSSPDAIEEVASFQPEV